MKMLQDIIIAPVVTERSMDAMAMKKYTFKVAKDAGKIEIGQAVEKMFPGTKVKSVNTMNCRGVMKRNGQHSGYTAAFKKAIVTLTEDSKGIEFFDSMR